MYMPEHISGTGDPISLAGIESFSLSGNSSAYENRVVEAGHDHFFYQIPEEAVGSIDYMQIMEKYQQFVANPDDDYIEVDPVRQLKKVGSQLKEISLTLNHLMEENERRDRREHFMWAGLAGLTVVAFVALIRK
ncbi:hypothetical protein L3Y34_012562 [Caenorhabditis briggsae]|uniref:Mitochondrial fission factor n=1 Tax=Caenorhabditis briggsae TaxID=6238 RepID=A0AAE9CVZ3_CAEBR|nr:hypothetical protein L3Y34_012562 [Caenorhabditis briggsae]